MVIGTSWTHKHIRCIARAFGDILFVDATEGTNDEERPLLTVSYFQIIKGKDVAGVLLIGVGQGLLTVLFHVHHQNTKKTFTILREQYNTGHTSG
eukprot:6115728-Ditylum_brightwellii.AAC.1